MKTDKKFDLLWFGWILCFGTLNLLHSTEPEGVSRPNVVLFFTDDHGTLDLGSYGAPDLFTPHIDGLAKEGVRFTQFYVAASVCSSSRASLLTGRHHIRAGVRGNVSSQPGQPGMPTEEVTLAELLRSAGYRTGLFGKWHLGTIPECDPLGQGFDEYFGHLGGCIDNYSHYFYWNGPHFHDLWRNRKEVYEDGIHFTELMVRESKRFIRQNRDQPFFLFMPFNLPHYPPQAPIEYREWYESVEEPRKSYAASLSWVDHAVGEVLTELDQLGIADNTFVIFLSDHGHSTEQRTGYAGGYAGDFRGAKFSLFEAGIRVPCIMRFPGKIEQGEVRTQVASSMDIFPTLAEWCGATLPDRDLDGRSLVPVLESSNAPSMHPQLFWMMGDQWAVREGSWKLVVNARDTDGRPVEGDEKVFLSHFLKDETERNNLVDQHPDVVERLTRLHKAWRKDL